MTPGPEFSEPVNNAAIFQDFKTSRLQEPRGRILRKGRIGSWSWTI